ncbi:MAG: hypothetical protein ACOYZ7_09335 [Chloroflexota bacterium]
MSGRVIVAAGGNVAVAVERGATVAVEEGGGVRVAGVVGEGLAAPVAVATEGAMRRHAGSKITKASRSHVRGW